MMGSPMQESSVNFHDWLTMKYTRKTRRAVYHITRLSSSLRASLISLVLLVTWDTSSPGEKSFVYKLFVQIYAGSMFSKPHRNIAS